jgi:DNA-binding MarR family transcriptional regulator
MTEQREVLELILARTREGRETSFRSLVREFELSPEAACGHLKRLWREGLIRSTEVPPRRRRTLSPGESIREMRFELARRGRRRLDWYKRKDAEQDDWTT